MDNTVYSAMGEVGATIVEEIADREGVDPVELDVPLYEAVDADALDVLVGGRGHRTPQTSLLVEFSYLGYDVAVDGDGAISIEG